MIALRALFVALGLVAIWQAIVVVFAPPAFMLPPAEGGNWLVVVLDAENGTLDVELSQSELDERKKAWKAPASSFSSGYLWKYSNEVGPARTGAVTHPGGGVEVACYADV